MSLRLIICIILAFAAPTLADASSPWVSSAWKEYNVLLAKQCPSRHVDLIVAGQYDNFLESFERGLSPAVQHKVAGIADTYMQRKCSGVQYGSSCNMATSLEAFRKLNLMHRFVAYSCHTVRCEDAGICSQFPRATP